MKAINQAAITPAPFQSYPLQFQPLGIQLVHEDCRKAHMEYQTAESEDRPRFVKNIAPSAIDQENSGGRGLIPPTG